LHFPVPIFGEEIQVKVARFARRFLQCGTLRVIFKHCDAQCILGFFIGLNMRGSMLSLSTNGGGNQSKRECV